MDYLRHLILHLINSDYRKIVLDHYIYDKFDGIEYSYKNCLKDFDSVG